MHSTHSLVLISQDGNGCKLVMGRHENPICRNIRIARRMLWLLMVLLMLLLLLLLLLKLLLLQLLL
ncbi:hypothetical protein E8P77_34545 [Soehngenia saccharolytica]|nr:hypothetical protein E8P77_34545 [Soehngenia saccharolytica]